MKLTEFVETMLDKNAPAIYVIEVTPFVLKQLRKVTSKKFKVHWESELKEDMYMRGTLFGRPLVICPYNATLYNKLCSKQVAVPVIFYLDKRADNREAKKGVKSLVDIDDYSEQALVKGLMKKVKESGFYVSESIALDVIKASKNDPYHAYLRLEELHLRTGKKAIEREDVYQLLEAINSKIFDLFDSLIRGMRLKVKNQLELLLDTEPPLKMLAALSTMTRRLLIARAYQNSNRDFGDFLNTVKMNDWAAKKAYSQAKSIPTDALNNLAIGLLNAEKDIKFHFKDPYIALLEHFFTAL